MQLTHILYRIINGTNTMQLTHTAHTKFALVKVTIAALQ
jgi:hypothetical protein